MPATHFTAGKGSLWAQIDGPNTKPYYLGCHQLGDVEEPQGDVELFYCPDPAAPDRFMVVGSVQGAAGAPTTSLTTDVTDELDYLERVNCPFPLYINMVKSGRRDVFNNFDRSFIFTGARVTSRGLTGLSTRTPDDNTRSEQSYDLSGESLLRFVELSISTQSTTESTALNDITFCNDETCRTNEQPYRAGCEVGYAVTDAGTGASANVIKTTNGSSWAATAADPFATDINVAAVECFELGRDTVRVIVARGESVSGAAAAIAYSDDGGTTWSTVLLPTANDDFIPAAQAMFALDRNNIWITTDLGYVLYSEDAGLSWSVLDAGDLTSGAINAIHFADESAGWMGGDSNFIARSVEGGQSWGVVTGPAAEAANNVTTLFAFDRNRAWVGYSSGRMYYTLDGGVNWTERAFTGSGVGQVRDVKFLNDYIGYMIRNNATPIGTMLYTIDGGYSWQPMTTPTNGGLNALFICDLWKVFAVGEVVGGNGFIAKAQP